MYISENCNWTPYGTDLKLDELVNSDNWEIRRDAAKQGYGLNKLIHDKYWDVRYAVAEQGYGLDILINDSNTFVRIAVARQGYGLDKLIYDKYSYVREIVAEQGYSLNKLITDEDYIVRWTVAEQGYGLDKLIKDKNPYVRKAVKKYLKENGYKSLNAWAKANPDKVHGNNNFETTDTIKDFIYKIDDSNTLKVESSYESVDAFFDDNSKESFESNEYIVILAVDMKIPLIKLEKVIKDEKQAYKFVVDLTNEDSDDFIVRSIISSKEIKSILLLISLLIL